MITRKVAAEIYDQRHKSPPAWNAAFHVRRGFPAGLFSPSRGTGLLQDFSEILSLLGLFKIVSDTLLAVLAAKMLLLQ
jgi:hypothetical protein